MFAVLCRRFPVIIAEFVFEDVVKSHNENKHPFALLMVCCEKINF